MDAYNQIAPSTVIQSSVVRPVVHGGSSVRRSLTIAVAVAALVTGAVCAAGPAGAAPVAAVPVTDFNADGYADIAVAAPGGTVNGKDDAGYVTVLYGSIGGVDTKRPQVISRASAGIPGDAVNYDSFGRVSAARDFDGDGYTDLVVGSENGPTIILWGSPTGLKDSVALSLPRTTARWPPVTSTVTGTRTWSSAPAWWAWSSARSPGPARRRAAPSSPSRTRRTHATSSSWAT